MNNSAMTIPKNQLVGEVTRRIENKNAQLQKQPPAVVLSSYMENIGWPELFGFKMGKFFADPDFAIEQSLRQQIWWADNVDDDSIPTLTMLADVGMYWDMTLFGQEVIHGDIGVPEFPAHPFRTTPDASLLGHFDFYRSGIMPQLLAKYQQMQLLNDRDYQGKLKILFPSFHRGPLDIYVQMRGYEEFIDDLQDDPEFVDKVLRFLVDERRRFAQERAIFLQEELPATTFVADDWVNIPFITPSFFKEMVVPIYAYLRAGEGAVTGFHTCGRMEAVVNDLLTVFPELDWLDVSGWNNLPQLDAIVEPKIKFHISIINTVSLGDSSEEQAVLLQQIAAIGAHRPLSVCAQAIVRLYPSYEETIARLNRFLARARKILQ